jgi:hypothetical protein
VGGGVVLSEMGEAVPPEILDLEAYEMARPPRRKRRELVVPKKMRVRMLRDEGYASSDLAEVEDEIKVIKEHRRRNARKGPWEIVQEVFQYSNDRSASVKRRQRSSYGLLTRASLPRKSMPAAC